MNALKDKNEKNEVGAMPVGLYSTLPRELSEELDRLSSSLGGALVSEIRLRADGVCWAVIRGRNLPLIYEIDGRGMAELADRLCKGSVHAHRDTILKGYLSIGEGVRVGVGGEARYEAGRLVGIGDPRSLCFRIPTGKSELAPSVYKFWRENDTPNVLILSSPAGGKTTLLRALCSLIGGGREPKRVVVVDERREFMREDYRGCLVDILAGYGRSEGVEIALRTMSPEVIVVDELGGEEDAQALLTAYGTGVSVIASCHGRSIEELRGRRGVSRLLELEMFAQFIKIENLEGRFGYTVLES